MMKQLVTSTLRQAAWAPATVLISHAIADKVFNAYATYPWIDIPAHFFGGVAITYFFLTAAANLQRVVGTIPYIVQLVLAVGLAAISAIVWEFVEYLCDLFLGSKISLGVTDTLSDLFFGLLGAFFMTAIACRGKIGRKIRGCADRA